MVLMKEFYHGRRVLVTGHTGFKGAWLCEILKFLGAQVVGYGLEPPTEPSLFALADAGRDIVSVIGDIRDGVHLREVFEENDPEIVIHMAAQPIVKESYRNPVETYSVNVMGTVNVLECARNSRSVRSVLNVTTDKVYRNREWEWGYREEDVLDGYDPYSNSKSCSELVTASYRRSFFEKNGCSVSTARAGNVIGGGDFARDRIVPDCVRHAVKREKIILRNPNSVRPYQFVLDPLFAYLLIAMRQFDDRRYEGSYNIGPGDDGCMTTGELARMFCHIWGEADWCVRGDDGQHEANMLKLDCSRFRNVFGWKCDQNLLHAMEQTVELYKAIYEKQGISEIMHRQLEERFEELGFS